MALVAGSAVGPAAVHVGAHVAGEDTWLVGGPQHGHGARRAVPPLPLGHTLGHLVTPQTCRQGGGGLVSVCSTEVREDGRKQMVSIWMAISMDPRGLCANYMQQ